MTIIHLWSNHNFLKIIIAFALYGLNWIVKHYTDHSAAVSKKTMWMKVKYLYSIVAVFRGKDESRQNAGQI